MLIVLLLDFAVFWFWCLFVGGFFWLCLACVLAILRYFTNNDLSLLLIVKNIAFHIKKKKKKAFCSCKQHSFLIKLLFLFPNNMSSSAQHCVPMSTFTEHYKYLRIKGFLRKFCHITGRIIIKKKFFKVCLDFRMWQLCQEFTFVQHFMNPSLSCKEPLLSEDLKSLLQPVHLRF